MRHSSIAAGLSVLVLLALGLIWAPTGIGLTVVKTTGEIPATAQFTPDKLPRSVPAPIKLVMGFKSPLVEGSTPELSRVAFEFSRHVTFQTVGLPSCPLAKLYSARVPARQSCAASLVGQGSVASEIRPPGRAPVTIVGHLLAFYTFVEGQSRILAQVISGEPLALTYVIPFTFGSAQRPFGTSLSVPRMGQIQGVCAPGPTCFGPSYRLEGVYSRISAFQMFLHHEFVYRGERKSLVNAICSPPQGFSTVSFPLLQVNREYSSDFLTPTTNAVERSCELRRSQTSPQGH